MLKLKPLCLLFGALLFIILFITLQQQAVPHQLPTGIKQSTIQHKPQRIISLSPGNTEILFALDAGDRVVGVSNYSDYPEEAKSKPNIGDYQAPDMEKIISLAPDLVCAMSESQAKYIRILERAGIPVIAVEPQTLPEILTAIDIISTAIGEPERGAALHTALASQLSEVRRLTAYAPPKRVFLEVWDAPLLTVGKQSFISDIIQQAGGFNVAATKNADYTPCDIEQLYTYDPEIYIVISHSRNDIRSFITRPDLADLNAVKNNQVYTLLDDLIVRPGPRSFTGLVKLAAILHPEIMQNGRQYEANY